MFNHFLWEMQNYALKVADLFLEETAASEKPAILQKSVVPIELNADRLENKAGKYFSASRAALRNVTYAGGRLQFQGLDLLPLSETLFFFEVEPQTQVEFLLEADGTITGMKTITSSGEYEYDRVEVSLTSNDLMQYDGAYYSPELDIYWRIVVEDGNLVVKRRKYVDSQLTPLFSDAFSDDWTPLMGYPTTYLVIFERDMNSTITGLRVSGSRVRHLKFVRQN